MDKILAAFIFFTRLPFYKIKEVSSDCYKHVVAYWSLTGWLTGLVMMLVYLFLTHAGLPPKFAVVASLLSRLLITGALHEDGLADVCDGFGGGTDRDSILRIMKDSHIGTYGVLGLIFYYLILIMVIMDLPARDIPLFFLGADAFSKCVCSHILYFLPYARKETEAKNQTIYDRLTPNEELISLLSGFVALMIIPGIFKLAIFMPLAMFTFLMLFFKKRIQGYTGDCCGASFLLCELSMMVGFLICTYCI